MNYAHIKDNILLDITNIKYSDKDIKNIEVSKSIFDIYSSDNNKIIYQNGEIILNPNYEKEQIELLKQSKLQKNKTAYNTKISAGLTYNNTLFDCDDLASQRLAGKTISSENITWLDYNWNSLELTPIQFEELKTLVEKSINDLTLKCGDYVTQI